MRLVKEEFEMKSTRLLRLAIGVFMLGVVGAPEAWAGGGARFEVTVTNLTSGQVFTPILAASHKRGVHLFMAGQPASTELEQLAEGGDVTPLSVALMGNPNVLDVTNSGAPLPPGHSTTVTVETSGRFTQISLAAMLVPTNDGFFSLNGVEGPKGNKTLTLNVPAYDAGTERNDELCASVPGPPSVCGGEGFNASREGAEGFVHIHAGIHGIGDLEAADHDWRNPVARISIRRVP